MSSGFVSGGTTDAPIERNDEWLAAQEELEAARRRKAEELRQSNGRSLYETLEANKVAKQEAFEEASRLKNQFRALDHDEIEFLDSVLESTRREEARVRRETAEGLQAFRLRRDEVDKELFLRQSRGGEVEGEGGGVQGGERDSRAEGGEENGEWVAKGAGKRKRKRKRRAAEERGGVVGGLRGVKIRRGSVAALGEGGEGSRPEVVESAAAAATTATPQTPAVGSPAMQKPGGAASKPGVVPEVKSTVSPHSQGKSSAATEVRGGLGLVDYGSDSD